MLRAREEPSLTPEKLLDLGTLLRRSRTGTLSSIRFCTAWRAKRHRCAHCNSFVSRTLPSYTPFRIAKHGSSRHRHRWSLTLSLMTRVPVSLFLFSLVTRVVKLSAVLEVPSESVETSMDEEQIARNVQALKNRLRGRGARGGRRGPGRSDIGSGRDSYPGSE